MSVPNDDYYLVLQVRPDAEADVVKSAYQSLLTKYHLGRDAPPEAALLIAAIKEAYGVLSDPAKRAIYDAGRASGALETQVAPATNVVVKSAPSWAEGWGWLLVGLFFAVSLWLQAELAPDIRIYLEMASGSMSWTSLLEFVSWLDFVIARAILPLASRGFIAGLIAVGGTHLLAPKEHRSLAYLVACLLVSMVGLFAVLGPLGRAPWSDVVSTLIFWSGAAFGGYVWYKYAEYYRTKNVNAERVDDS